MPTPLSIQLVEDRLGELRTLIDGIAGDLREAGVEGLDDLDPEDFPEATRHYILAWNRAYQVFGELSKAGGALDPNWEPPAGLVRSRR